MGLDDLATGVMGGGGGGGSVDGVMKSIDRAGGVDGLMSKPQSSGLTDQVGSWVDSGSNEAVSGDQIRDAIGDDELKQAGVDPDDSGGLADALPDVIDKLTPDGKIPEPEQLKGLLGALGR